jgi:hypothetical protein
MTPFRSLQKSQEIPDSNFSPELSVIVVVGPLRARARRLFAAISAQTVARTLELVVADLNSEEGEPLELPKGLATRIVPLHQGCTWGEARAAALREANAPIVAFIEDHCYPEPHWAEALMDAHRGPWAAVGYAFTNADPSTYVTRAGLVVDYGKWMHPAKGGPGNLLSYNNVSYKREILSQLEQPLERLMATDFHVHSELVRRDLPLFVASEAVAAHENYALLGELLSANHQYCRALAADRSRIEGWSTHRRILQGLMTPMVAPAFSILRLLRTLPGRSALLPSVLKATPVLVLSALWSGIGESLGYLWGGKAMEDRIRYWEVEAPRSIDS